MSVRPSVGLSIALSIGWSVGHIELKSRKNAVFSNIKVSEGMKRKSKTIGTTFKSYRYKSKSKNAINSTN